MQSSNYIGHLTIILYNMPKTQLHFSLTYFSGTHRFLVTNKKCRLYPAQKNCQGQQQIPQSISVAKYTDLVMSC